MKKEPVERLRAKKSRLVNGIYYLSNMLIIILVLSLIAPGCFGEEKNSGNEKNNSKTAVEGELVEIPDDVLRGSISYRLEIDEEKITKEHMEEINSLDIIIGHLGGPNPVIKDLAGLEYAVNLKQLVLYMESNYVSDITPLSELKKIETLRIQGGNVNNVTPLANLKNLKRLDLKVNVVEDVSPLANLKNLENLNISGNEVKDVSPLANLENLERLYLVSNKVEDVSPLANLKNLEHLNFNDNKVEDVSPLVNLKNLERLNISYNSIRDIEPLLNLENLDRLNITKNYIDTTPGSESMEIIEELKDKGVKVEYKPQEENIEDNHVLSMEVEGQGTIEPEPGKHVYNKDDKETVDLAAAPAKGWEFKEWRGEVEDTKSKETVITMNDDREIVAVFKRTDKAEANLGRLYGADRYDTAVEISQEAFKQDGSAETVVLARGDDFPDALAGVPLAHSLEAPILLTRTNQLLETVEEEIVRLGVEEVYLLGGQAALSEEIEAGLEEMGLQVERIGGEDRYHTAKMIADITAPAGSNRAIVTSGLEFQDALIASPYAAAEGMPVLLTASERVPASTQKAMESLGVQATLVLGHTEKISDEVMEQLPDAERVGEPAHYSNAVEAARYFDPPEEEIYLATGESFADAVAGGVLAAFNQSGILLVEEPVPPEVTNYLEESSPEKITVFGGPAAVGQEIIDALFR